MIGFIVGLAVTAGGSLSATADEASDHFEARIRPVLVKQCYECHSQESGKAKGGLQLDTREAIRRGGDSGPALVPGTPEESLLYIAIRQSNPDLEMPPKGPPLPAAVVADFEKWIRDGAPDPRESAPGATSTETVIKTRDLDHWSYRPLNPRDASTVEGSPIDFFVESTLTKAGLTLSAETSPLILLRRLCFDLTGLPPSPEQVANFSVDQLEKTVDDLLASEGFGVRWGRHWLDVVRFAESNGKEANIIYPHAWRYRDYVIDAVQRDLPYDRFLIEQLAGDLLPAGDSPTRARQLIATGFLALGAKGLSEQNPALFAADVADEQMDALGRAWLASSIACARCHDHKSDPYWMEDYYALVGIFKSTDTRFGTWIDSENNRGGRLIVLPRDAGQLIVQGDLSQQEVAALQSQLAQLNADEAKGKASQATMMASGKDPQEGFNEALREALRIYWSRGPIVGKLETVDEHGKALPLCMGALEAEKPVHSPRYERGEIDHPAETITRAIPPWFGLKGEGPVPEAESGRLQLAHWLTDPAHPLTARVMVNRIWSHLCGAGLVATVDNFGPTGAEPSHPELLDWLTRRFQESGWSTKSLIRDIVLSRTYRQDSTWRADAFAIDPDNRLLWRMPPRRLDAEVIRDAMLSVSGELDPTPRPASLAAELSIATASMIAFNDKIPRDLDGSMRRSLYLPVFRDQLPDILGLFDFAEPSLVTGNREQTNVPPQALYLMNSEFVRARAASFAARIADEAATQAEQIDRAFLLCYNRVPDDAERSLVEAYFSAPEVTPETALINFCHALLASAEFRIAD
jgi:Protein of unknown function (DUF1553)/Protein of unknown function (DUF1549)/Planctomycete cytochrome C